MSYKKTSILFSFVLIVLSSICIYTANQIKMPMNTIYTAGPRFYPILLCSACILVSILSIIDQYRKEDKIIKIPNIKNYFIVLGVSALWAFIWRTFDAFYPASFLCIGIFLFLFNPAEKSIKKLVNTLLIDAGITSFVFITFQLLLRVDL